MASAEWRPGMATSCGKCGALTLSYATDGSATCITCGAVTPPAWGPPAAAQPPSGPAPVSPTGTPPPPSSAPPPGGSGARPRGRQRGIFLPGKATRQQRAMYAVGAVLCGTLVALILGVDIAAGSTGILDGAFVGGFGAATILFLAGVVTGRPIRWR